MCMYKFLGIKTTKIHISLFTDSDHILLSTYMQCFNRFLWYRRITYKCNIINNQIAEQTSCKVSKSHGSAKVKL